jgi:hypothetical protein
MHCTLLLLFAALLLGPAEPPVAPGWSDADHGGGWRMTWLDLDVAVEVEQRTLTVEGTAILRLDKALISNGPTLALNSNQPTMRFVTVEAEAPAQVELNAAHPQRSNTLLAHLRFADTFKRGDEVEVTFRCESEGPGASQLKIHPRIALASWVEAWYPVALPLPGEGFNATLGAAPGLTQFELPPKWRSVSAGVLIEREESDEGTREIWEDEYSVARSFAAAEYSVTSHEVGGRAVSVYRYAGRVTPQGASMPKGAEEQARSLALALQAQEERFGPYPYATCNIAEVPAGMFTWGAASQQGFIMATSWSFNFGANLPLFAHEACHAWWGNLVNTRGSGSKVCSESLAQYGAVIAIESIEGQEAVRQFLNFSRIGYVPQQCARGYFEILRDGRDLPLAEMSGQDPDLTHNLADSKGTWMYHMLRRRVGDEVFFATLRGLIEEFAGRRMSLADVRAAFVATAPERRLKAFFRQWLDRTGAPILDVEYDPASPAELVLHQRTQPYDLELELGLVRGSEVTLHQVHLSESQTSVALPGGEPLDEVRLDPNYRLLLWRPEYGARPGVEN